jgi:MscS family membrane protein
MTNRRIYETIGIRYADATAIDLIVEQVKAYLEGHDGIDQDQTLMVSFTTFAPSSLDFFVYCYTRTQSGPVFYRIKQEIMLHILGIVEENGAECAFPTTTIHMQGASVVADSEAGKNQ